MIDISSLAPVRLQRALHSELEYLAAKSGTLGIMIFGSVARGDANDQSDIELLVLDPDVMAPEVQGFLRHDVFIHEHIVPHIDLEARAAIPWKIRPPLADALIALDRDGRMQQLRELDQKLAAAGRPALTRPEVEACRRSLTRRASELVRYRGCPDAGSLLSAEMLQSAVDTYYSWRRRWQPGTKRLLKDLDEFDPILSSLVRRALHPAPERVEGTIALVDHVLGLLGGWYAFPVRDSL